QNVERADAVRCEVVLDLGGEDVVPLGEIEVVGPVEVLAERADLLFEVAVDLESPVLELEGAGVRRQPEQQERGGEQAGGGREGDPGGGGTCGRAADSPLARR